VSAILFGILGAIIGIAVGLFLGFALGTVLATALHVPAREGEAAYFTVAIALIVTCIVTPVSILAALYWRGVGSMWLFIGLVMVCVSIAAIGASGFGLWYAAQPHVLNLNGPTPLLEFEVKPPGSQALETLANVEPELAFLWRHRLPDSLQTGLSGAINGGTHCPQRVGYCILPPGICYVLGRLRKNWPSATAVVFRRSRST
jgi:hypothetical protein